MNDSYNKEIVYQGRRYRYDPDHDCFYSIPSQIGLWDRWGWIAVIVVLAAVAVYFEFLPIR
jgi:hypothetical protein